MSYFKKKIDVWGRVVREFISKGVVFNNCIIVNSYLELLHTSIPRLHASLVLLQSLVGKHLNHVTVLHRLLSSVRAGIWICWEDGIHGIGLSKIDQNHLCTPSVYSFKIHEQRPKLSLT